MQKIKTKYEGVDYWWSGCVYRIVEFGIDALKKPCLSEAETFYSFYNLVTVLLLIVLEFGKDSTNKQ